MRTEYDDVNRAWLDGFDTTNKEWQYRIAKPAQEPKYLWVYHDAEELKVKFTPYKLAENPCHLFFMGKIRLEE